MQGGGAAGLSKGKVPFLRDPGIQLAAVLGDAVRAHAFTSIYPWEGSGVTTSLGNLQKKDYEKVTLKAK